MLAVAFTRARACADLIAERPQHSPDFVDETQRHICFTLREVLAAPDHENVTLYFSGRSFRVREIPQIDACVIRVMPLST